MKHLLYIPNGTYINIKVNSGIYRNILEHYQKFSSCEEVIQKIIIGYFPSNFYKRQELPNSLTREEFEIIDDEKTKILQKM